MTIGLNYNRCHNVAFVEIILEVLVEDLLFIP